MPLRDAVLKVLCDCATPRGGMLQAGVKHHQTGSTIGLGFVNGKIRTRQCLVLQLAGGRQISADAEAGVNLMRSEEHTSELQSLTNLVCRLLLEKKKKQTN